MRIGAFTSKNTSMMMADILYLGLIQDDLKAIEIVSGHCDYGDMLFFGGLACFNDLYGLSAVRKTDFSLYSLCQMLLSILPDYRSSQ